jgi:hypothetical protein
MFWTKEKLASLSLIDVKNLAENAKSKGNDAVFSLCEEELVNRKPKPKTPFGMPEGFVRVARTAVGKTLERDVSDLLVAVAKDLASKYDLGPEKARSLSIGTKRFIPHKLLDGKGNAKTGGAQKAGRVVFDRYISYRLRDDNYALVGILLDGDDEAGVRYQVLGPSSLLSNYRLFKDLRPYLLDGETLGGNLGGEEFDNFEEASARYVWMIDQVAPKV